MGKSLRVSGMKMLYRLLTIGAYEDAKKLKHFSDDILQHNFVVNAVKNSQWEIIHFLLVNFNLSLSLPIKINARLYNSLFECLRNHNQGSIIIDASSCKINNIINTGLAHLNPKKTNTNDFVEAVFSLPKNDREEIVNLLCFQEALILNHRLPPITEKVPQNKQKLDEKNASLNLVDTTSSKYRLFDQLARSSNEELNEKLKNMEFPYEVVWK